MKKKKRVSGLAKTATAVFAVYAAFTLVSLQLQIAEKKEEQALLQAQIEEQELRNAEIKALLESENSDDYVARIAREKLGYISPGERVFVDISSK
ncbi:MAG: septum formation initiator family protein [Clostridiaceae bacterium]|jgi:cell division protein DivIC|nr:septum formation initiator family protein [Clostridiaceae bacterium]